MPAGRANSPRRRQRGNTTELKGILLTTVTIAVNATRPGVAEDVLNFIQSDVIVPIGFSEPPTLLHTIEDHASEMNRVRINQMAEVRHISVTVMLARGFLQCGLDASGPPDRGPMRVVVDADRRGAIPHQRAQSLAVQRQPTARGKQR
jgi:hypothetical protein